MTNPNVASSRPDIGGKYPSVSEPLNGAQISSLQKQVMERLHAAVNDVELRKIALQSSIQINLALPSAGGVMPCARLIYEFLVEPAKEFKLTINHQE